MFVASEAFGTMGMMNNTDAELTDSKELIGVGVRREGDSPLYAHELSLTPMDHEDPTLLMCRLCAPSRTVKCSRMYPMPRLLPCSVLAKTPMLRHNSVANASHYGRATAPGGVLDWRG